MSKLPQRIQHIRVGHEPDRVTLEFFTAASVKRPDVLPKYWDETDRAAIVKLDYTLARETAQLAMLDGMEVSS